MKLNAEEFVQAFGLLIAIGCALYSLGNYAAGGNFGDDAEKYAAHLMPSIGAACLLLTAAWKTVAIRGEMKRREVSDHLRQGESGSSFSSSEVMLTEASSFWFYDGVLLITIQSMIYVAGAVTLNTNYYTVASVALPIAAFVYFCSIFCQPRRHSPEDMWKLRLYFAR